LPVTTYIGLVGWPGGQISAHEVATTIDVAPQEREYQSEFEGCRQGGGGAGEACSEP
jgi:hypothetical protein